MSKPAYLEILLVHLFQLSAPRGNSSPIPGGNAPTPLPTLLRLTAAMGVEPAAVERGMTQLAKRGLVDRGACRLTLAGLAVAAALGAAHTRQRPRLQRAIAPRRRGDEARRSRGSSAQEHRAVAIRASVQRAA